MKKKRSVTKRVLAFVLAFAMMFTAMSWEGVGMMVAKADTTPVTFYYYYEGDRTLALTTWCWNKVTPPNTTWIGKKTDTTDYYGVERVQGTNWYKISLTYNPDSSATGDTGFELAEVSVTEQVVTVEKKLEKFDPQWENTEIFGKIFDGSITNPAYKDSELKSYEEWNKSEEPEEPTIPEGDVANGDFENDLDGWTKNRDTNS